MKQQSLIDQSQLDGKIKVLADVKNPATCLSVRISPNLEYFAVSLANGKVHLFSAKNDKLIYKLNNHTKTKTYSATSIRFRPWGLQNLTPNNILIATFTDGSVKTYHFPSLTCVHKMNEGREVITCDYSKAGDTFATSGNDGVLKIYDDETRKLLISYEPPFYENASFRRIYSIAYHPINTDELITGGWDDIVRYYDFRIPHMVKMSYGPHICGEGLDFSPNGREFCSASWRKEDALQIWDYGSAKLLKTFTQIDNGSGNRPRKAMPSCLNYSCKYSSESQILVGGTMDNAVSIINTKTGETKMAIKELQKSVYSVHCSKSILAFIAGEYVGFIHWIQ